jgi:glycosyltransferase involved in cell wall biosynthesis
MERNPWKYLARADLYVLSSHTEAFPNTIGEALALKVPVVAVDCSPGVAEYLQNGECGLLLEPNDEAELARGMERMLSDRALREGFVQRGLIRVNEFGLPGVVRRYEQLLLDVIDSP